MSHFNFNHNFNCNIIPIAEHHIEGFREAVGSVAREQKYLGFLDTLPLHMTRKFVLENLRDGWPHVVAIITDQVVGWCDITSLHRPIFAHAGTLGIGVIATYRGRGIGEALLRAALVKAHSKGLTRIELTVRAPNRAAIALYKKLGFVIEGLHQKAVLLNGEYEDMISMALLSV